MENSDDTGTDSFFSDGAERGGGKGHVRSAHTFEERQLRNARAGSRMPPCVYVPYCAVVSHALSAGVLTTMQAQHNKPPLKQENGTGLN